MMCSCNGLNVDAIVVLQVAAFSFWSRTAASVRTKLAGYFVQRPHELGDGRLHGAQQLGDELLAARQGCERLDVLGGHHLVGIAPACDDELVVALGKVVQDLRHGNRIAGPMP